MSAQSLQSCLTLWNPIDCSPPDSSVHGILQARILEWVAISFSSGSPDPGIKLMSLMSPALAGRFFTTSATWEALREHMQAYTCMQSLYSKIANSPL